MVENIKQTNQDLLIVGNKLKYDESIFKNFSYLLIYCATTRLSKYKMIIKKKTSANCC